MRSGSPPTRVALLIGGLLAMVLLFAACAGEAEGPRLDAPPEATVGGTLTVAIPPPAAIDPGDVHEPIGAMIAATMCDTLLGIDHETGELVPGLAESWVVTDDGERILLRLREGLRFHDGTELNAEDIVYSLSRMASASFAGRAADLLAPVAGFREIRGQVIDAPQHLRDRLGGVQQLTPQTVQITLDEPQAGFVAVLTHPATAPVSRTAVEADPDGFAHQPVCAGPYRLADPWEPGQREIRLVRHDAHHGMHGSYTGGGAGYAEEIVLHAVGELAAPADVDVEGDSATGGGDGSDEQDDDGSPQPTADPEIAPPTLDGFDAVVSSARVLDAIADDPGLDVVTAPGPGVEYVGIPVDGPALSTEGDGDGADERLDEDRLGDRQLRLALSEALDRRHIAETVFGGARAPATGFLPPTLGTTVTGSPTCRDHAPTDGDVDAARDRLERAGISLRGHVLEFAFNDELRNAELIEEVARQWEEAFGVTIALRGLPWEEYREEIEQVGGPRSAFRTSWSVPYPSADRYLYPLFHTSGVGQTNLSGYSDADFERLITEEAREAEEEADRVLLYQELEEMVCADMPLIPVLFEQTSYAVRTDRIASASGAYAGGPRGELLLRELYLPER